MRGGEGEGGCRAALIRRTVLFAVALGVPRAAHCREHTATGAPVVGICRRTPAGLLLGLRGGGRKPNTRVNGRKTRQQQGFQDLLRGQEGGAKDAAASFPLSPAMKGLDGSGRRGVWSHEEAAAMESWGAGADDDVIEEAVAAGRWSNAFQRAFGGAGMGDTDDHLKDLERGHLFGGDQTGWQATQKSADDIPGQPQRPKRLARAGMRAQHGVGKAKRGLVERRMAKIDVDGSMQDEDSEEESDEDEVTELSDDESKLHGEIDALASQSNDREGGLTFVSDSHELDSEEMRKMFGTKQGKYAVFNGENQGGRGGGWSAGNDERDYDANKKERAGEMVPASDGRRAETPEGAISSHMRADSSGEAQERSQARFGGEMDADADVEDKKPVFQRKQERPGADRVLIEGERDEDDVVEKPAEAKRKDKEKRIAALLAEIAILKQGKGRGLGREAEEKAPTPPADEANDAATVNVAMRDVEDEAEDEELDALIAAETQVHQAAPQLDHEELWRQWTAQDYPAPICLPDVDGNKTLPPVRAVSHIPAEQRPFRCMFDGTECASAMELFDYIREKHIQVHNRLKPGQDTFFPRDRMQHALEKAEQNVRKTEDHRVRMRTLAAWKKRKQQVDARRARGLPTDDDDEVAWEEEGDYAVSQGQAAKKAAKGQQASSKKQRGSAGADVRSGGRRTSVRGREIREFDKFGRKLPDTRSRKTRAPGRRLRGLENAHKSSRSSLYA